MPTDRPDWGDGERSSFASTAMVPVDPDTLPAPADMLAEMQGEQVQTPDGGDPLAGLSNFVREGAVHVAEQILVDAPDDFVDTFDTLSSGLQRRVFEVMAACPHKRGLDLIEAIERKLTLGEAVEATEWVRALPEHHKAWLRGRGE